MVETFYNKHTYTHFQLNQYVSFQQYVDGLCKIDSLCKM